MNSVAIPIRTRKVCQKISFMGVLGDSMALRYAHTMDRHLRRATHVMTRCGDEIRTVTLRKIWGTE
jgi:hypothetical protein